MAASIFTKNIDQAIMVSNSLRAGAVWVNCYYALDAAAPFGKLKYYLKIMIKLSKISDKQIKVVLRNLVLEENKANMVYQTI